MPVSSRTCARFRLAMAPALFLAMAVAVAAEARQPEPKKGGETAPKVENSAKGKEPRVVKLPDGTFLWLGSDPDGTDERVTLTPAELQKLLDQTEQLKKQLAARRPTAPSGYAVRGRVEKRGEQLVAVLTLTGTFRTTAPQTAIALGGRRGFLVSATLDGDKLPVLETTEDGFAVLVEKPGDHTLTLNLEAPVTSRGAKPELGFEIGLPRAPITTLLFDPPGPDVKRVNLTTRTPDPGKAAPPEPRRTPGLDVIQLAMRPGHETGYPLGPVDSLEVTWDPPATAQPADQVQSAELDVAVQLTEGFVETTTKFKLRGPAREWKLVTPANTDITIDRAPGAGAEVGPTLPPVVAQPSDPNKPVWKVEFPPGSSAADWVATAVTRYPRPKPEDAKHRGPFPIGPFAALDVLRQTGTVSVKAGRHTRFAFKHGPDLRRAEPPGPTEDEGAAAFFRLLTGPTGANPTNTPMLTVEAWPQTGNVAVKPTYRLSLTDAGWRVRAEVKVFPIRTEIDSVVVEVPSGWRGLEASPPELVEGVQQVAAEGFWAVNAARLVGILRESVVVRLAAGQKQPFDLLLTATVPVDPTDAAASLVLPRFPGAFEKESAVTATVPDGLEVRGELRGWDGEFALWGEPLAPVPGADGRPPRVTTAVAAKSETGIARVLLSWNPYRPNYTADVRADVVLGDRQLEVAQRMTLRSPDGFPRQVRLRAPTGVANVKGQPALTQSGQEWLLPVAADAKEVALAVSFAVPLPPRPADVGTAWQVPVGLLWPVGTRRADVTARVWSSATASRAISTLSPGWRELVAEPSPDRDTLPVFSAAASGSEFPLTLEVRESGNPGAVAVWIDRGLLQAWAGGDAATEYRTRLLLRRWLTPAVEVRLPALLAGPNPEFRIDGLKANAVPLPEGSGGERAYRVPLPAPGKPVVVEVRYQLPAASGRSGEASYQPPILPTAAFTGPVRWQVTLPPGTAALHTGGGTSELRWQFGPTGIAPAPYASTDGLERWFLTGDEPTGGDAGDALTVRQSSPGTVAVYRVPRTGMYILCSVGAFLAVLVASRLPGRLLGPVVAVVGGAVGIAAVLFPQPAAFVVGASQPGLAGAAFVLMVLGAARLVHHRRVTRLPGFSRAAPEPHEDPQPLPSSSRKRPSVLGSSGAAPAAPSGG